MWAVLSRTVGRGWRPGRTVRHNPSRLCLTVLFSRDLHPGRNNDVHGHALIHRGDKVVASAIVEDSHHRLLLTLRDLKNPPFPPSIGADSPQFHQDAVAMHGVGNVRGTDEDIPLELAPRSGRQ